MADPLAMAARGLPPCGVGIYLRDRASLADLVDADFAAVLAERGDAEAQVRALGGAWLYSMPGRWGVGTWRAELARLLSMRDRIRARGGTVHGIIANPEHGWNGRSDEATRLGATLSDLTEDVRVGIVTVPFWSQRRALAAAADGCWFSPEIYGRTAQGRGTFSGWMELWTSLVGVSRVIPSIAAWPSHAAIRSASGYRSYLDSLPRAAGAIAWPQAGPMSSVYSDGLRGFEPGGSVAGTYVLALRNLIARPAAMAVLAGLVLLVMVAAIGAEVV